MEKIGRARRKDPVQENIVSKKDDLNKRTSALIKLLIDTKRSWNGREAPDIGIAEPHRLTDPLPDETIRAVDVIDRGLEEIKAILSGVKTEQDQYAAGFAERKKVVEQSVPVQAGLDSLLNKTASNALSRFWARVSAPFGMETGRWERLRMLRRLSEMMHNLKEIDEDILSEDPGVLDGLYKAKDLYINLRNDFFDDLYEYVTSTSKDLSKEVDRLKAAIKAKDKEAGKKPIPAENTDQLSSERSDKGRKKKKEKDEGERPSIITDAPVPSEGGEPVDTSGVVRDREQPERVPGNNNVDVPPPPGRARMPSPPPEPEPEVVIQPQTGTTSEPQTETDPNQLIPFSPVRAPAGPRRVPGFRQPIEQTQTPAPVVQPPAQPDLGAGPMPQPPPPAGMKPLGDQLSRLPPVPQEAVAPTIPIVVEPPEAVVEPEPPAEESASTQIATEQAEPETGTISEEDYSFAQAVPQNIRGKISNLIFHDTDGVLGKKIMGMCQEVYVSKGIKGNPSVKEIAERLPKDVFDHFDFFGERYKELYSEYSKKISTDKVQALELGIMILANFDMMENIIDAFKKNKDIPNPDDPSPTATAEGMNIWQSLVSSRTQDVEEAIIEEFSANGIDGDWSISKIKAVLSKIVRRKAIHIDNNIVKFATTMLTRWLKRLRTNLIWDKRDRQLRQKLDQAIHKCLKSGDDVMSYLEKRNMDLKSLINTSEKFTDDLIYMFDKLSDIAEMYNNRMRIDKSKKKINKEKFNFDLIPQSQTYISRASDWLNAYKTKLSKLRELEEDVVAKQQELAREKTEEEIRQEGNKVMEDMIDRHFDKQMSKDDIDHVMNLF